MRRRPEPDRERRAPGRPARLSSALIVERARERVREEPLFMLAATAGIAYVLGLLARR